MKGLVSGRWQRWVSGLQGRQKQRPRLMHPWAQRAASCTRHAEVQAICMPPRSPVMQKKREVWGRPQLLPARHTRYASIEPGRGVVAMGGTVGKITALIRKT